MNNFLLFIGGLVVLILGALFAVPMFVDWNSYRGVFEEEASRLIGREVRVNGAVNLRLLPTPTVRFEGVRVADAAGRTGEPFFRADDFTLHLAVGTLLQGVVEATEVELKRPVLRIAFDDQGGANWQGLRGGDQRTGFTPKDLALPSIKITDGTLVVHGRSGDERLRIEKISGEIGAPSLDGPFKARLTFAAGGVEQEARIATARAEGDGTIRVKATMRGHASGASWAIDGRVAGIHERPGFKGDISGKLPMGLQVRKVTGKSGDDVVDLKATLAADAAGFEVGDLAMSFEQEGRPQLLTGTVKGSWRDATTIDAALSSHWLDLDRIFASADKTPIGIVGRIAEGLDWLPRTIKLSLRTTIEQATIAGDVASGLVLDLDRADRTITVRELRIAVPGNSRIEARGIVAAAGSPEQRFDGEVIARGASLARALGWAFRGLPVPEIARDGSFGIHTKLSISASDISANDIAAELNGNGLTGSLGYSWADRKRLSIAIEGAEVDAGLIAIGDLGLGRVLAAIASGEPLRPAARPPRMPDVIRVRLNAGRLLVGDRSLRDVSADVVLEAASVGIDTLRLTTEDGIALEASGRITGLETSPKGALGWQVSAGDAAALASAVALLGVPAEWRPSEARIATLVPLRLAGTMTVGQRSADARDLTLDGLANASRISGAIRLDAGPKGLADTPADVTVEMSSPEVGKLLRQLVPAEAAAITERFGTGRGRLQFKSLGRLATGAMALALIEAPGLAAEYSGRLALAGGRLALEGDARINGELPRALIIAGLGARPGFDGAAIKGSARLLVKDGALRIDGSALQIAGADVSARASWPVIGSDRLQLDVRASEVSLAGLLGLVLEGRALPRDPGALANPTALWSDNAFDLSVLERLPATVRLETPRLRLAPDLAISDAALDIRLGGGKADIIMATGRVAGGTIRSQLALAKAPAGAELAAEIRINGLDLALLAPAADAKATATGKANIDVKLAGKALSLRGLIVALEGKGQIELGPTRLPRYAPSAVSAAVEAAILVKEAVAGADLRRLLVEKLAAGELVIGPRRLPIEIVEGQARLAALTVDTAEGRVVTRSQLDLESLRLDSEWKIEPKAVAAPGAKRPALPPVTILFSGPFARLGRLEGDLKTDALEREISVRRMEREVDELERLRREDEARALQEAERLKSLVPQPPAGPTPAPQGAAPAAPQPPPVAAGAVVGPAPQQGGQPPDQAAPAPAPKGDVAPPPEPKAAPTPAPAPVPPAPRPAKRPQYVNPFKTDGGG